MKHLTLRIALVQVLLTVIFIIVLTPWRAFGTRCDCKPEFEVYAEANGVCEVTRDDRKWCEIRFNSSTGRGARQNEFFQGVLKLGVEISDNVTAAERLNTVEPEKWDKTYIDQHLVSLLAVALWERAPERLKPIIELVRKASEQILEFMRMKRREAQRLSLERYTATVSHGCFDLDDKVFAVMIKTRFSEANERCDFIRPR